MGQSKRFDKMLGTLLGGKKQRSWIRIGVGVLLVAWMMLVGTWIRLGRQEVQRLKDFMQALPKKQARFKAAMEWLHQRQLPESCSPCSATTIELGLGGGFGSQFQLTAASLAQIIQRGGVGAVVGDFKTYTNNPECKRFSPNSGFECFFEPLTTCWDPSCKVKEHESLKWEQELREKVKGQGFGEFDSAGPEFVWGVVQSHLFRLNQRMRSHMKDLKDKHKLHKIDLALHMRFGDKPLPIGMGPVNYMQQAQHVVDWLDAECRGTQGTGCPEIVVYVATDSKNAIHYVRRWERVQRPNVRVVMFETQTQRLSELHVEIGNLHLHNLTKEDLEGDTLYQLGREIVTDIELLKSARFFIGMVTSQPARAAVAMGTASGQMEQAICMDGYMLPRHDAMKMVDFNWVEPPHPFRDWFGRIVWHWTHPKIN